MVDSEIAIAPTILEKVALYLSKMAITVNQYYIKIAFVVFDSINSVEDLKIELSKILAREKNKILLFNVISLTSFVKYIFSLISFKKNELDLKDNEIPSSFMPSSLENVIDLNIMFFLIFLFLFVIILVFIRSKNKEENPFIVFSSGPEGVGEEQLPPNLGNSQNQPKVPKATQKYNSSYAGPSENVTNKSSSFSRDLGAGASFFWNSLGTNIKVVLGVSAIIIGGVLSQSQTTIVIDWELSFKPRGSTDYIIWKIEKSYTFNEKKEP